MTEPSSSRHAALGVAVHKLTSDPSLDVLIVSTPASRRLLTTPDLTGSAFKKCLGEAVASSLVAAPRYSDLSHHGLNVLTILRGGLSFGLSETLPLLLNYEPSVSFLSSQSVRTVSGVAIEDDSYSRWCIEDGTVLVGDISATGTTLETALRRMFQQFERQGKSVRYLVIVTIGTSTALQTLSQLAQSLVASSRLLAPVTIIFLEGIFSLYSGKPSLHGHTPYTDFILSNALLAPEFEMALFEKPRSYLEACVIYDGGVRAFEPSNHLTTLAKYWQQLRAGVHGIRLASLLEAKSNLTASEDLSDFLDAPSAAAFDYTQMRSSRLVTYRELIRTDLATLIDARLAEIMEAQSVRHY